MRVDCTVFVRFNTTIRLRIDDAGHVDIHLEGVGNCGNDVRLSFVSLDDAARVADAIYHAKMDRDAPIICGDVEIAK